MHPSPVKRRWSSDASNADLGTALLSHPFLRNKSAARGPAAQAAKLRLRRATLPLLMVVDRWRSIGACYLASLRGEGGRRGAPPHHQKSTRTASPEAEQSRRIRRARTTEHPKFGS